MTRTSLLVASLIASLAGTADSQQQASSSKPAETPIERKLAAAQSAGKHTFILFTKDFDQTTRAMATDLGNALAKRRSEVAWALIRVDDPVEQKIVSHCNPQSATLPCVMVVAPNKVVTGMIPGKITDSLVEEAIVTPAFAKCLLSMQQQKWTILCVLPANAKTIPKGAHQFSTAPSMQGQANVITVRANNPVEAKLVKQLGLSSDTSGRVILMSPVEQTVVGTFGVNVAAETLWTAIVARQPAPPK